MKTAIRRLLRHLGYDIVRRTGTQEGRVPGYPPDFDAATIALCDRVQPYTMTSKERLFALRRSVEYVVAHGIPGAFVECGVWKGGSAMAMALTLLERGRADRPIYLFDTFAGMPPPGAEDRSFAGQSAAELLRAAKGPDALMRGYSPLADVERAMSTTGYPSDKLVFVAGKVEETLPANAPEQIALLRLDTDWHASTLHELVHLYPRLAVGGVLIVDDYGHWEGARRAVDRYIEEHELKLLLCRIDYTGRICVKLEA